MKRFSQILSILLVLALILPGFTFAEQPNNLSDQEKILYQKVAEKFKSNSQEKLDLEKYDGIFNKDDEVRIIVELESEPSIVYATERNMRYQEMSRNTIDKIERAIEVEQRNVKNAILSKKIDMEFINSFKTAFNGFSGKVKFGDVEIIERLPSVRKVYIANEYERPEITPEMITSGDMVGSGNAWQLGYKGEGTVIAIIDTGIDPSHRDMVLSEGIVPKLTEEDIEELDLLGGYYTEKVPYGYNYYDLNDVILDLGPDASMHGMHVAGIAGANGDTENGGIKGVAPEAQLLAMKVFSNDPIYATTFSDIYLVAIDEAIRLGADVLNMSLGSTSSFYIPDSAENVAITNATDNGIVCSVSAGNSGSITYGWAGTNYGYPWPENPDIGVVGAPGLNKDTIQVASIENIEQQVNVLAYEKDGETHNIAMAIAGNIDPAAALPEAIEFVDCGDGSPEFLTDVGGKVALVVRGGNTPNFVDKIQNAQDAGAAGIIVRNHETGGEELVNMMTPPVQTIPAVFIGYQGGLALLELENKMVTFTDEMMGVPNPNGGLLADSSSWGTTPSLELKPEITAPGAQIYSTLNDDKYGVMSGTSMAAPHVAGGSALVMEYIKEHEEYGNLSLAEQTRLAKILLMNTAKIIIEDEYPGIVYPYSPRRQGAGLMNLYGAVSTPVRVVNAATNEAKVELKDFEDTEFTMTFKAINDTDTDATYDVDVMVLMDYIHPIGLNLLSTDYIYDADIDAPDTITVPANDEIEFDVTINIGTDETIYWNMFVEGFVTLVDPNDNNPALSVPYVGFYGDWGEPNILDGMAFIDPVGYSYFDASGMIHWDIFGSGYYYTSPRVYMSTGTFEGMYFGTDNIMPYLSFMRNAEVVNYNILDSEGNNLRTIFKEDYVRKNYIDGGRRSPVRMVPSAEWYGTINGEYLPDGDYFYEIAAKIHYDGAEFQSKRIPITIDTVAPVIENFEFDPETKKLTFNVVETSGIEGFIVEINGEEVDEVPVRKENSSTYELDILNHIGELEVVIIAVDYAMNMGIGTTEVVIDNTDSYIYIYSPLLLEAYDSNEILFEGFVANFAALDKVIINETEEADIQFFESVVLRHPDDPTLIIYQGPAYKFTKELALEDGYKEIKVEAISKTGAISSLVRRFFVDTTAPELQIDVTHIDNREMTADLEITMYDNLGYLYLYNGDSQVYLYEEPLVKPDPSEKTFNLTVNIEEGENTFVFTLIDLAGHETVQEITISSEIITNLQPEEDVELRAGESVEISFNALAGGEAYCEILLPFGTSGTSPRIPMEEYSPGFYRVLWTAPENLLAYDMLIQATFKKADINVAKIADGTLTIVGDMEDLPINSVIIGEEAFDIRFLDTDANAQAKLEAWDGPVYVKLNRSTIVNADGEVVNINLPNRLYYYDRNGQMAIYTRLR